MGPTFQNCGVSIAGSDNSYLDEGAYAAFMLEELSSRMAEDGAIKMLAERGDHRSSKTQRNARMIKLPPIQSSTTSLASPGFLATEINRDHKEAGLNTIGDCVKSARDATNLGDTKPSDQKGS